MSVTELPPRGHYLAREVGHLAGVSGRTIGQWARRGYIRSSQSDGNPRVYSYQDVAEAMYVHLLLERHVSHAAIMAGIKLIRGATGLAWPLTNTPIRIPTDHAIHDRGVSKPTLAFRSGVGWVDAKTGHQVFSDVDLEELRSDLARGGWAARDRPFEHIEVNPDRMSGRPTIRGRRLPAEQVARAAESSQGRSALRKDYELSKGEIDEAVAWWSAVESFEHHDHVA